MRAAVFLHLEGDSSGLLGKALENAGVTLEEFHLYDGVPTPDPVDHDVLVVMGAAQQVWEEEANPWLVAEKAAIRHWVRTEGSPFSGFASVTSCSLIHSAGKWAWLKQVKSASCR